MDPVFPPEVVDIILSHCGRGELLNCRRVCKAWNDLCLQHLAKSRHTHYLPYKKINDFVTFLRDTRSKPILPLKVAKLPRLHPLDETVVTVLESLLEVIGPLPIVDLKLEFFRNNPDWMKILPFLERIGATLRSLELPGNFFNGTQEMTYRASGISFPKLKYIRFGYEMNDRLQTLNKSEMEFYTSLLSRCPALEVLDLFGNLTTDSGDAEVLIPFKSLKAFCNSWFCNPRGALNQIKSGSPGDVKVNLEACRFEPLNIDMPTSFKEGMLDILQRLAPDLRHLLHTVRYPENHEAISLIHFPMLSRLDLSQGIWKIHFQGGEVPPLNLRAELLPTLTTLSVPIGPYLVAHPDSAPLITVRHLILKAPTRVAMRSMITNDYTTFFNHVFNVCPNATRLSVEAFLEPRTNVVIRELMQCTQAAGVEELGFWNYTEDWVGKEFLGISYPWWSPKQSDTEYTFKNIRKLRLSQGKYGYDYSTCIGGSIAKFELDFNPETSSVRSCTNFLHLGAMRSHFPNLRSLEFSPRMLGYNYRSSWAAAREIQSKYPNWEVDLISTDLNLFPVIFKGFYPAQQL